MNPASRRPLEKVELDRFVTGHRSLAVGLTQIEAGRQAVAVWLKNFGCHSLPAGLDQFVGRRHFVRIVLEGLAAGRHFVTTGLEGSVAGRHFVIIGLEGFVAGRHFATIALAHFVGGLHFVSAALMDFEIGCCSEC